MTGLKPDPTTAGDLQQKACGSFVCIVLYLRTLESFRTLAPQADTRRAGLSRLLLPRLGFHRAAGARRGGAAAKRNCAFALFSFQRTEARVRNFSCDPLFQPLLLLLRWRPSGEPCELTAFFQLMSTLAVVRQRFLLNRGERCAEDCRAWARRS
jgi:hypothetical protein